MLLTTLAVLLFCNRYQRIASSSPNLVLITIDCLRADRLGAYGNTSHLTPNLDSLAKNGIVFERVFAPIATTHPSHASMLTGLYPRYHGVRSNGMALAPEAVSVAELLQAAGYSTGAFVSYQAMLFRAKLDQGFDEVSDRERPKDRRWRRRRETTRLAKSWLSAQAEEPFFLWVHFFEPHVPYELQDYSARIFSLRGYEGSPIDQLNQETIGLTEAERRKYVRSSPEYVDALRTLYDGEVHAVDQSVGDLVASLEGLEFLDNTVIIATGDHGEGLGENGRWQHGPVLFNYALQIPLIIRDFRKSESKRVRELVGLVDIAPTLLEMADLPTPDGLQGRSLLPAARGERLRRQPYFSEVSIKEDNTLKRVAVFVDRFKLLVWDDRILLYDLDEDPEGAQPLPMEDFEETRRHLVSLAEGFMAGSEKALEVPLEAEDIEELRALGYL